MLHSYFHYDGNTLPAAVVSVVGAASLAAGTTQTLSTALIVLEMTREMSFLVPVLLAVIVSCCVSELLSYSIYDQILVLKDLPYMPHLRTRGLGDRIASEIMKPTQKATTHRPRWPRRRPGRCWKGPARTRVGVARACP